MQDVLITFQHIEALRRYHATLTDLPQTTRWLIERLGIGADPQFVQIYQPALEQTLQLASHRVAQWPDLYALYPRAFHEQQRLNADIRTFHADFEAVLASLPIEQRRDYLSKLDLRQLPFALEGKLLALSPGPAWPFAQQMKNAVAQIYSAFWSGANVINRLHENNREILPRITDFLNGAKQTYVGKHKLDPERGDVHTAFIDAELIQITEQQRDLIHATEQLSEGFTRLVKMQSQALDEFSALFSTIRSAEFQLMVELALPLLAEAEHTARL